MSADPFGVLAAQTALDAALEAREALLVECVTEGMTHQVAADVFGITRQRVGQIMTRHRNTHRAAPITPGQRLREAREAYRLALHAQTERAEAYGLGYKAETAAFYGDPSQAPADSTENRLRWKDFLREYQVTADA